MIAYILIAWILIQMKAPMWTYIFLAIGIAFKLFVAGTKLGELGSKDK